MAVPAREMGDDTVLVRAVQAGDLEAFSELFRRHYPAVQRACARRMACPLEAEEIAQAAFVRALERIDQCRGQRPFGAWVQVIARHMCVDRLRARSRVVPKASPMSENHTDGNQPDDPLLDRERTMEVRRALDSLPPRQRHAVTARAEGTGPGEIADDLGLSVGAVDSLILRGRRRLALAYRRVAGESGSTAVVTTPRVGAAASFLAALAVGPTRVLGGVAAAAEAGRDLVTPVAQGVAGAILSVAVVFTGSGPATDPEPASPPSARTPAVVITVPELEEPIATTGPAGVTAGQAGATVGQAGAATGGAVHDEAPTALGAAGTGPSADPSGAGTAHGAATAGGPAAVPAATGAPPPQPTADVTDPALPLDEVTAPVVEPVAQTVDDTLPAVTGVVDTLGDTVDGLLPK
jgi:RNA polymerase sigma-70 factor, ECF subfamily